MYPFTGTRTNVALGARSISPSDWFSSPAESSRLGCGERMWRKKYGGRDLFAIFGSEEGSFENSSSTHFRTSFSRLAVRGNVERIVRPSKSRTCRLTVCDCEPLVEVDVVRGDLWVSCCAASFFSLSRSSLRASAWALRSALSASIRAFTRASSSASSRFFLRTASRAACWVAVKARGVESGLDVGDGTAFCFPLVLAGVGFCVGVVWGSWFP